MASKTLDIINAIGDIRERKNIEILVNLKEEFSQVYILFDRNVSPIDKAKIQQEVSNLLNGVVNVVSVYTD